jgi:hypothetical protein
MHVPLDLSLPEIGFASPEYLVTLPLAAGLLAFWLLAFGLARRSRPVRTHGSSYPVVGRGKLWFLMTAVLVLTALAAARPFVVQGSSAFQRGGVDIAIAVDASASMWLEDVSDASRLSIASRELMALHREGILQPADRIALFVFGGTAIRKVHLSADPARFADAVSRLRQPAVLTGDVFPWASDIAAALEHVYHSLDRYDRFEAGEQEDWTPLHRTDRVLLLFTDGDFAVDPVQLRRLEQALAECRRRGLVIYPIGVGSQPGRELVEVLRNYQRGRDYDDSLVAELKAEPRSRLDTQSLRLIAQRTGGRLFTIETEGATATGFLRSAIASHRSLALSLTREESQQEVWSYVLFAAILIALLAGLAY